MGLHTGSTLSGLDARYPTPGGQLWGCVSGPPVTSSVRPIPHTRKPKLCGCKQVDDPLERPIPHTRTPKLCGCVSSRGAHSGVPDLARRLHQCRAEAPTLLSRGVSVGLYWISARKAVSVSWWTCSDVWECLT